jgi:predicted alpha/beta-fold hydrolase
MTSQRAKLAYALLGLSLLSFQARADWPAWAQTRIEASHSDAAGFSDGYAYTVWGALQMRRARWYLLPEIADRKVVTVPDAEFSGPGLPLAIHLSQSHGQVNPAPLLILLTGIFGNVTDPFCTSQMQFYSSLGYHVVAIPNPWSTSYRRAKPRTLPGSIRSEAAAVLRLVHWAQNYIGPDRVKRTDLVGLSYGGFLAAVADVEDGGQLLDGYVTSFSPPEDLANSGARLDLETSLITSRDHDRCHSMVSSPLFLAEYFLAHSSGRVAERYQSCSDYRVVTDFLSWLGELVVAFDEPDLEAMWRKNPSFASFFDLYAPLVPLELQTEGSRLASWIAQMTPETRARYRVLTANDDLLNGPDSWYGYPSSQVEVLPQGGHVGYLFDPWVKGLRRDLFKSD